VSEPSPSLAETLESTRDLLRQADSVLGCLCFALTYGPETEGRPSYSALEVAEAARSIVQASIDRLDPAKVLPTAPASPAA